MTMYRKKAISVKAVQWFPPGDPRYNAHEFPVNHDVGVGTIISERPDNYHMNTLSGWVALEPGDWIITGPTQLKDLYPCKPEIFEATYEEVKE